jgi:hypothetical protein
MFADPFAITYNAVTKNLNRINQDNRGSDYYLDDGQDKYSMSIRHNIPSRGGSGESHHLRLDIERFDADGIYLRTDSVWVVAKTTDGVQSTTDLDHLTDSLAAALDSTTVGKLLAREN